MLTELGYCVAVSDWPSSAQSPPISQEEIRKIGDSFDLLYECAISDLRDTGMGALASVLVEVISDDSERASTDYVRELGQALRGEWELQGQVNLQPARVGDGNLGGLAQVLEVAVGAGGAVGALSAVAIAWIRQQASDIKLKISIGDAEVELEGSRIKSLTPEALDDYIAKLEQLIESTRSDLEISNDQPESSS